MEGAAEGSEAVCLSFDIGIQNLAYCEVGMRTGAIGRWGILNLTDASAKKKPSLDELCQRLLEVLAETFSDTRYACVLLENQPVFKNPIMKSIQIMVYTFFQMLKLLHGSVEDVRLVSARNKLQGIEEWGGPSAHADPAFCAALERLPAQGYQRNKKSAILYTQHFLDHLVPNGNDPAVRRVFTEARKKDDLADAFLQAWSTLTRSNVLKVSVKDG
jgi:hypothetical protein